MRRFVLVVAAIAALDGQQPSTQTGSQTQPAPLVPTAVVRAIEPPSTPLPSESRSAGITRFSFIAYGDTRGANDGLGPNPEHEALVELMIARIKALAATPFPIRFVVQSGDAVLNGREANQWSVSFNPTIDRLIHDGGVPYFFAVGNHDVTTLPVDDPQRQRGLKNTLDAMAKLMPPDNSPRRLKGYPTYSFGYGNAFFILLDSNVATDQVQLAWVTRQLDGLDTRRYRHVFAVFHHPVFSSGPHGGDVIEPPTEAMRALYMPLFRKHHVRMTLTGHDHLLDHWIERYQAGRPEKSYRIDHIVSGGGGAPIYTYKGEPNVTAYLDNGAAEHVRLQHVIHPGATTAENPHHFAVITVDGDRLSLEVISSAGTAYRPYGRERVELDDPERIQGSGFKVPGSFSFSVR
jgi:hypothetical protein